MSEYFYVFLCILTFKSTLYTNILLNVKCMCWYLSIIEYNLNYTIYEVTGKRKFVSRMWLLTRRTSIIDIIGAGVAELPSLRVTDISK